MNKIIAAFLCGLVIGAAITYKLKKNTTSFLVRGGGSIVVRAKQGEKLTWTFPTDTEKVNFPLGAPCVDELPTKECTIKSNADVGLYPYQCGRCKDPEIVVESSIGILKGPQPFAPAARPDHDDEPVLYCKDGTTPSAYPETVTRDKSDTVEWAPIHGLTTEWKVWQFSTPICDQDHYPYPNYPDGTPVCKISDTASSGTVEYKIHIPACSATDGTGHIKIR